MNERSADGAIWAVDLRQDLDACPRHGENADNLAGLQAWAGRPGKYGLGNPQSPGFALRKQAEPAGGLFR